MNGANMTVIIKDGYIEVKADLTPQERAFCVAFELADGRCLTTREVANLTGLTMTGAWYLMQRNSRVAPIYQDDDGRWRRLK